MDTTYSKSRKFNRMFLNILSIFVILAMAFPITGNAQAQEPIAKIGLVVTESGIADNGLNLLAYQGLQRAEADMGIMSSLYTPADQNGYGTMLQQCADDGNELCIAVGFPFGVSLANAARANPDMKWAIVDWSYPDCWEGAVEGVDCGSFTEIPNVRGLRFNEKQAGYLAGVLAAGMTASNVVGAVGGMEIPPVVAFVEGYRNGAQCSNPQVNVLSNYTGTFVDPDLGASTAQGMIGQGADVIFGAAGLTGDGAITYSAQNDRWAIGVDADEYLTVFGGGTVDGSDKLLSSAMKRYDNAVYQTIEDYVNGTFSSGTVIYDLAMDGVGLAPFHETDGSIPQTVKDQIEGVKQGIIGGTINIDDPCAHPPTPHIEAFAWFDRYSLVDWPTGIPINVTIENPNYQSAFTPDGSSNWYAFYPGVDLQPGSVITATNGDITKVLEISPLSATADSDTGFVQGVATADRTFHMKTDGDNFQLPIEQDITAGSDGNWSVTIAEYLPWAWFTRGEMWEGDDDGDVTYAIWHVQQQVIEVWLAQNEIRAFGWPRDTDLEFYVNDTYLGTASTQPTDWFEGTSAVLNAGDLHLEPGMVVTVTDGSTPKSTTIQDLKITNIDIDNDIVYGYAPANADLELGSWEDSPVFRFFNNGNDTNWAIDYKEPSLNGVTVDLNPGDEIRLFMRDADKDSTVWQSFASNPHFTVFPEWEFFDGWEWLDGSIVSISVEGKPECNLEKESWGGFFNGNFPEGCDVAIGDTVTFTDGVTVSTHTVQNLSVTNVDMAANTVGGIADSGAIVGVWPHETGQGLLATTGEDGIWQVDFTGVFDLVAGTCGRSQIFVGVNATAVDWCAPKPWLIAYPENEAVEGWEWPVGTTVTLTIDNAPEGFERSGIAEVTTWGDPRTYIRFDFADAYDLQIGDVVTLTDEYGTTRTHIVQNLSITAVDANEDTIAGTANEGAVVQVWPHETGQQLQATVDASGTWQVDFTGVFDLVGGKAGRSQVLDEFGNATAVDWAVPFIWADPLCECINGWSWIDGDTITLQVFDQNNNEFELQNPTQVYTAENGAAFELGGEGIDLQPGYRIVMSNGLITKELIISPLVVKEMNPVANTISGIFDPNLELDIHTGGQEPLSLDFNGDYWVATFESVPLDGFGEVSQPDEDGDRTGMGWGGVPTFMRYDIYALNVQNMNIQRVTMLDGTGEYNPSWSPNGKKIAHDVVYWDGTQSIYITDVKTGESLPLAGAENGNDAVWSPNGKWIVFDRDSSLYLVPSGGGVATLVRGNAISADWAPSGKRLVFQQPSDGSLHTIAVDGGKGGETLIAASGANPSWSPDGNWIAYENGGDIWKVAVNAQGKTLGDPIQVTSSSFNDGQPTWSADSLTIVYHSGFTNDWDLWSVPAVGGEPTWLNGAPEFGDYDPAYAKNSSSVAYASISPDGQAARQWVAAYTYDYGTWSDGDHSYHFEATWNGGSETSNEIFFTVSGNAQPYDGYVLLRPGAVRAAPDCTTVDAIRPDQPTRFHAGYVTDYPMTYSEALAYFASLTASAVWDDGQSASLTSHEIIPFNSDDWTQYVCTFTSP